MAWQGNQQGSPRLWIAIPAENCPGSAAGPCYHRVTALDPRSDHSKRVAAEEGKDPADAVE